MRIYPANLENFRGIYISLELLTFLPLLVCTCLVVCLVMCFVLQLNETVSNFSSPTWPWTKARARECEMSSKFAYKVKSVALSMESQSASIYIFMKFRFPLLFRYLCARGHKQNIHNFRYLVDAVSKPRGLQPQGLT